MEKRTEEWLKQSDYDMDTAEYMHKGSRYIYAVFMCHLAVEKSLKGFYYEKLKEMASKSHNLILLMNKIEIKPPENFGKFIIRLNESSIPTRYPESLAKLNQIYDEEVSKEIIHQAKEFIKWIKKQF
jgi:HEPN domain-containing protein